jgi:hypothetical protein
MFLPNRLNEALMPMLLTAYEQHMQKAAKDFRKLQKVAEASDPTPKQRSETIGKLLQSGMLRPGSGYLNKRAQERRFPIEHDDPEKASLNKQVGVALARQPGHAFYPGMAISDSLSKIASSGVGSAARKMVDENNANLLPLNARYLPGQEGPSISEGAIEVMNSLPDARVRQGVVNVLLSRPPLSNNDRYVWLQSIITLREQINEMTAAIGLDPSALIDTLDRRAEFFFDPMVQDRPSRPTSPASSVSPNIDDPASFFDVPAPEEPMAVNPNFAGSDRTDLQPDFRNKSVLAKFYKGLKTGQDICKTPSQREMLEDHAKVVLKCDFPSGLRNQIMSLHAARNRTPHAEWLKVQRTPIYKSIVNAIANMKGLSDQLRGACISLITSRRQPAPYYLPG